MELAGPAAYMRGVTYTDRVQQLSVRGDRVDATVRGTMPYTVWLAVEGSHPQWSCTCPAAEDGSFCKHCVAVALALDPDRKDGAWLDEQAQADEPPPDLNDYVAGLNQQQLVELVLAQADSDWRLRERLQAEARAARGQGADLGAWRRRIDSVFGPYGDFVPYAEAAGWAQDVNQVIDALAELCAAGHPDAVMVLTEHAHGCADQAIQYVDDSDGWLTDISERLADLHLRACTEGSVRPRELARRLVDLELSSELDGFHRAARDYADILGEEGLAEYRTLLMPRWEALAPDTERSSTERFAVREALIAVALASVDPDELIEARRNDLRTPDAYLEIAHTLVAADRMDEAVEWARQGLEAHADRTWQTTPLREFLAGVLRERGQESGAVDLFWRTFEGAPSATAYRRLLQEAGEEKNAYGALAIRLLRDRIASGGSRSTVAGVLVEVLLYEGQVDQAWDTAVQHGCDDRLWLTLAHAREATHPLDAIGVYQQAMFAGIGVKNKPAYRRAVELLARIKRLSLEGGQPERFAELLGRVKTEHKAKRNLMALIDKKGW